MTILIVEDDPDNLELLSMILDEHGFDTLEAEGGKKGMDLLMEYSDSIDIVLLDLMMPEMDGFRFMSVMGENDQLKEIPVIVVTALDGSDDIQKAFGMGAFDYITKPYDALALVARTRSAIRFFETNMKLKERNDMLSELINETEAQRKRLEETISYMDGLIDILDHKIRNKLVPIITYSETYTDLLEEGDTKKAMSGILQSSIQLNESIEDILYDMRSRTRSMETSMHDLDIRNLMNAISRKNKTVLTEENLSMDVEIGPDVPKTVRTDITLFYDILDNLISNAIKYSNPGGMINVMISTSKNEDSSEGKHLRVEVKDSGIGIDEKYMDDIFKRNFTIHLDHFEKKINRSGMGLYLVKKFVSAMGGDIGVESEPGKGSTFTFNIPLVTPSGDPS